MTTVIHINDINLILKDYQGAKVKIWSFVVTHQKLFLQLHHPQKDNIVYLVANGCEQIIGPFSWRNANLHVSEKKEQSTEIESLIVDKDAGFRLLSSGGVVLAYDLEKEDIETW